jgi:hypothetical protein
MARLWNRLRIVRTLVAAVVLPVAALCAPVAAWAQPAGPRATPRSSSSSAAVDQFKEAVALFERNEIAAACRKFEQLYAEGAAPGTLYNMAVCHEREGKLVEAYSEYDDLASRAEAAVRTDKAAAIRARANAILPRLARLDLIHRADAVSGVIGLSLDGRALLPDAWRRPVFVAPGRHVLDVTHADGTVVTRRTEALPAGGAARLEMEDPAPVRITPSKPQARPLVLWEETRVNRPRRALAVAAGAVGFGLVVAGAVLGLTAFAKRNDEERACLAGVCPSVAAQANAIQERHDGKVDGTLSTLGFAAGATSLAAGVILFVSSRQRVTVRESGWRLTPWSDGHGGGLGAGLSF